MSRKLFPILVIAAWGMVALPVSNQANATTPLVKAVIQNLRNLVQLIPQNQPKRNARKADAMIPGDGLSTGRASLAELRFNDGSLARVGEQAVFRFLPKTRNFKLSNGTVLLLIPPGQGRTRINTPNAAAAIRGSGLFVRYDENSDTSLVGALTDSGIEVSNRDASQRLVLKPGQVIVVVKGRFQGLYNFDLRTFYETSDLVRGLDLTREKSEPSADPAIAKVQEETAAAAAAQSPITGQGVVENPPFVQLTAAPNPPSNTSINTNNPTNNPVNSVVDTQETVSDSTKQSGNNRGQDNTDTNNSNVTPPIIIQTPAPPATTPTTPIQTESPTPPVTTPPVTPTKPESPTPPVTTPPVTPTKPESPTPPVTTPPVTPTKPESPTPPVTTPPVTPIPQTPPTPPVDTTPVTPIPPTPPTPPIDTKPEIPLPTPTPPIPST